MRSRLISVSNETRSTSGLVNGKCQDTKSVDFGSFGKKKSTSGCEVAEVLTIKEAIGRQTTKKDEQQYGKKRKGRPQAYTKSMFSLW